jgi:predicted AAA+ superfamily ATPase
MAWFAGYATTILQREVRDLANIDGLAALPRLLALVAARATTLLNTAELGRSAGIPNTLGADARRFAADRGLLGPLLENLVAMELVKQAAWSESRPAPYHFRSHAGEEVDVVLEDGAGRVVGVEVKAAATVDSKDLRRLRALAGALGRKFVRGVVLYTGEEVVPFGERLHALPVATLWTLRAG